MTLTDVVAVADAVDNDDAPHCVITGGSIISFMHTGMNHHHTAP